MTPPADDPSRRAGGMTRRSFLRLTAALGVAAHWKPPPGLAVASTLPLPFPHHYFPDADSLLARPLAAFDLLLVPAYAAADLARRGALRAMPGMARSPGRAHDPDGAFTVPYSAAISALAYRGVPPSSLDDLWRRDALWPDSSRLVLGTALLRRGYPLNDAHPGHLAQVEKDLAQLRPRIVADPLAGMRSGLAPLALALVPVSSAWPQPSAAGKEARAGVCLPLEGSALVEYDWAIPLDAPQAEAALALVARLPPPAFDPPPQHRLVPLTPLPGAARAQRAEIWARLQQASRS